MNNNDFDNGSNNVNDPFLPPTNNDVPAYSARGTQNLNRPTNQMTNTETLDVEPLKNTQETLNVDSPKNTQEALFVDISDGEEKQEVVTDIPKEEIIVKEVIEEHVVPEIDKFLAPETDPYPNLEVKPNSANPIPSNVANVSETPNVVSSSVQEVKEEKVALPPREVNSNYANPLPSSVANVSETPSVVSSSVQEVKEERVAPPPREVNPYTHEEIVGNRFAGVFDNASKPEGVQVEVPAYQERPTLTPPPSRKVSKSKGIPLNVILLILLFVFGFIFVMFLPEISEFFGGLFSNRRG